MIEEMAERGFLRTEFEARLARVQALMAKQELDALFLMSEAEIRYFTGFQTLFWQSPTRPLVSCRSGSGETCRRHPRDRSGVDAQDMA